MVIRALSLPVHPQTAHSSFSYVSYSYGERDELLRALRPAGASPTGGPEESSPLDEMPEGIQAARRGERKSYVRLNDGDVDKESLRWLKTALNTWAAHSNSSDSNPRADPSTSHREIIKEVDSGVVDEETKRLFGEFQRTHTYSYLSDEGKKEIIPLKVDLVYGLQSAQALEDELERVSSAKGRLDNRLLSIYKELQSKYSSLKLPGTKDLVPEYKGEPRLVKGTSLSLAPDAAAALEERNSKQDSFDDPIALLQGYTTYEQQSYHYGLLLERRGVEGADGLRYFAPGTSLLHSGRAVLIRAYLGDENKEEALTQIKADLGALGWELTPADPEERDLFFMQRSEAKSELSNQ